MPLSLLPVVPSDLDNLIEIYFLSFQNPLALVAFPDVPPVRQWWTDSIAAEMSDPTALFIKVVEAESDEIIAWAKWNRPVSGKNEEPLPEWPEGGNKALAQEFFEKVGEAHQRMMGDRAHWCEFLLTTGPLPEMRVELISVQISSSSQRIHRISAKAQAACSWTMCAN